MDQSERTVPAGLGEEMLAQVDEMLDQCVH
jgi:hypothetical protein